MSNSDNKLLFHLADHIVQEHHKDFGDADDPLPYLDWEAIDKSNMQKEWLHTKITDFTHEYDIEHDSTLAYWFACIHDFSDIRKLHEAYTFLVTTVSSQKTMNALMHEAVERIEPTEIADPIDELTHNLKNDIVAYRNKHGFGQFGPELIQEAFDDFHQHVLDIVEYFKGPPIFNADPNDDDAYRKEDSRNQRIFGTIHYDCFDRFKRIKKEKNPRTQAKDYIVMGLMAGLNFAVNGLPVPSFDNRTYDLHAVNRIAHHWGKPDENIVLRTIACNIIAENFQLHTDICYTHDGEIDWYNNKCFDVLNDVDKLFRPDPGPKPKTVTSPS